MTQEVLKLKDDIDFLKINNAAGLLERKVLDYKSQDKIKKYDSEGY